MMCDARRLEKAASRGSRISLLFPMFILLAALGLGGCAKASEPSSVTEPESRSAALVTEAPETTDAIPETTPESATPVPETTPEPATPVPETTENVPETTSEPATDPENQIPVRRQGGNGDPIAMLPLSEIPYERPDIEGIIADMDALIALAETADDVRPIIDAYKDILGRMDKAQSLETLAYFRHCQDVTDPYYSSENKYNELQGLIMRMKHGELLCALKASPLRERLEKAYFGRGYFQYYVKELNETFLELVQKEEELNEAYHDLTALSVVSYQGTAKPLNEWMTSESDEVRDGASAAYIREYHEPLGQLYLELLKVRHQIALSMGYKNYLSYAYKARYYRDYSPDRANEFFERVKTNLIPVLRALYEQNPKLHHIALPASLREDPVGHLALAAKEMGGGIWEAYRFMEAYGLCDAASSPAKRREGLTTYIGEYEAPLIFVNPALYGDGLTVSHEFGHFVDAYLNYAKGGHLEIDEAFSTAMEYLAVAYDPSLDPEERAACLRTVLISKVLRYIGERCAYADFEAQVYTRNPEELTLDELDDMYYQCRQVYGLLDRYPEEAERGSWVAMRHFFAYPEYFIAYPIANIVSLQIIRLETSDPRAGLEAFYRLLGRSPWAGVETIARNAKLQSPFASDTLQQIAEFLWEALELPREEE